MSHQQKRKRVPIKAPSPDSAAAAAAATTAPEKSRKPSVFERLGGQQVM